MSDFTGPLRVEHMAADWRTWRLLEPLTWEVDHLGSGDFIIVPEDFITDGASVPRLLWWIFPMTGQYLRAAVLHDFLIVCIRAGMPDPHAPKRSDADTIFRDAMKACGVSFLVRWMFYLAASIAGRFF